MIHRTFIIELHWLEEKNDLNKLDLNKKKLKFTITFPMNSIIVNTSSFTDDNQLEGRLKKIRVEVTFNLIIIRYKLYSVICTENFIIIDSKIANTRQ